MHEQERLTKQELGPRINFPEPAGAFGQKETSMDLRKPKQSKAKQQAKATSSTPAFPLPFLSRLSLATRPVTRD